MEHSSFTNDNIRHNDDDANDDDDADDDDDVEKRFPLLLLVLSVLSVA